MLTSIQKTLLLGLVMLGFGFYLALSTKYSISQIR